MAEPQMCGECGCKHRPGENTLCPGWRPGPFVPDPTPERIAAALALAEADIDVATSRTDSPEHARARIRRHEARVAYRATAPKLRTRAQVDAEIVAAVRHHAELWPPEGPSDPYAAGERWRRIKRLCAEPLAPDPEPNRVTDHDADQRPHPYGPSSVDSADPPPSSVPAAGATFSEPDACGCEQSDDLKDRLTECRRLLRAIHGFAKSITELSAEVP